ncbi:MAG: hypothetical protein EGR16_05400 [Clostridiales bacterium]|nr:hypothetical protein [Clostridiales bacterium]
MTEIFKNIFIMSLTAAAVSAFLLIIKPITRRIFSPRWNYYIWIFVLIIMLLPVSLRLPKHIGYQSAAISAGVYTEVYAVSTAAQSRMTFLQLFERYAGILSKIQLGGTILFFGIRMFGYSRFIRLMHKKSTLCSGCKGQINIPVRKSKFITSPIIVGLFRPVLYLPDNSDEKLKYVFMHEKIHQKRRDLIVKWMAVIASIIHWFNPFSYIILRQIDTECELSCDFEATKNLSSAERKEYMQVILAFAESNTAGNPLIAKFSSDKRLLKKRFSLIKTPPRTCSAMSVMSGLLALIILLCAACVNGRFKPNKSTESQNLISVNSDTDRNDAAAEQETEEAPNIKPELQSPLSEKLRNTAGSSSVKNTNVERERTGFKKTVSGKSSSEPTSSDNSRNSENSESSANSGNLNTQKETPKIKSTERLDEAGSFDLISLKNDNGISYIRDVLKQDGKLESSASSSDLTQSYIVGSYSYKDNKAKKNGNIRCDENGNISVYFETNSDNIMGVSISDSSTNEPVGSYGVLANNDNVYSFCGLNKDKSYDIEIESKTTGEWAVEGSYIIY